MSSVERGRRGEDQACRFLEERDYRILRRNVRSRRGEADIVALDDRTVRFVEVKSWETFGKAELEFAIDGPKQRRIVSAARRFLADHPELAEYRLSFDVLLLQPGRSQVEYLSGAFDASEAWT